MSYKVLRFVGYKDECKLTLAVVGLSTFTRTCDMFNSINVKKLYIKRYFYIIYTL